MTSTLPADPVNKEKTMDEALEKAIDEVGRDRVMFRAKSHGWGHDTPPKWVWWGIVQELRDNVPPPATNEGIFDFLWK